MRRRARRVFALWLCVGCAPVVGTSGADEDATVPPYVDLDPGADIPPFDDPPRDPPEGLGDVAWDGPAVPRADGMYSYTDPGQLPTIRDASGHGLPLKHTHVDAELRAHFAEVTVTQTFVNEATDPIEVVYAFPLPENSAVSRMRIVVGDHVIESEVKKREVAKAIYDEAKTEGHTAALLEQERPNIFTQSLANLPPGEDIDVEIEYLQALSWDAGEYEFVFPMVVGPRFIPGQPTGTTQGVGTSPDTDQVPDASRISPPVVGEGMRRGDDFTIEVRAAPGFPIADWSVPTHRVLADPHDGMLDLKLAKADELPNRDFVLRYRTEATAPKATLLLGKPDAGGTGHYAVVVEPPKIDVDAKVGRRELVFVVDRSGSMWGLPLALAKQTVRETVGHLRPVDTFNIVAFESGVEKLWETPRPANATNVALALAFLAGLDAGGGTMMSGATEAALRDDVGKGRNRYVMFLTDGFIGNEAEIFAGARTFVKRLGDRGQRARVFGVGIGSAPNRYLIAGLSDAGSGVPLEVGAFDTSERAVGAFVRYVDHPVVEKLRLDGGGLTLAQAHPTALPDLFASHLVVAYGTYSGRATKPPTLQGTVDGRAVEVALTVVTSADTAAIDVLWARAAVADLEPRLWAGEDPEAAEAITQLGLTHHIVTPLTSFIAVDRSRTVGDGLPRQVVEPTLTPAGVSQSHAGGISLAGTTGAEMSYTVSGVSVNRPSFGTVGSAYVQEFVEHSHGVARLDGELHGDWPNNPRLLIGRATDSKGKPARDFRKAAREARPRIRHCWAKSAAFSRYERHHLTIEVSMDGGKRKVRLRGSTGDDDTDACIERAVEWVSWPALPHGEPVSVSLSLSAH